MEVGELKEKQELRKRSRFRLFSDWMEDKSQFGGISQPTRG